MIVKTQQQLDGLMRIGQICGQTLLHMLRYVEPGITTKQLDNIGAAFMKKQGAASAPIMTYKYPGWTCISVNEAVAHGIPSERVLKAGDVVNIDVSATLEGYWADTGASMIIPPAKPECARLLEQTRAALYAGMAQAVAGNRIYDISRAIEAVAVRGRYSVIRELTGHGVGLALHEDPTIPNYFQKHYDEVLVEGQVFTIEPFFSLGRGRIRTARDGWTLYTADRMISAQFEHTIVVQAGEPLAVTRVDGGH